LQALHFSTLFEKVSSFSYANFYLFASAVYFILFTQGFFISPFRLLSFILIYFYRPDPSCPGWSITFYHLRSKRIAVSLGLFDHSS